jgi:hypothetical protein
MSYADDMNATPLNKLPPPVVQSKQDLMGPAAPPNYKDLLTKMDVNAGGPPAASRAQQMMMMQQQDDEPEEYYPQQQQQQQQMMYGPPPQGMFPGYNTYNSYDPPPQPQPRHEPSHRSSKKLKSALKDKNGGGGVMGFLKKHKNVIIVAIVAFLAMRYVAPRLRAFPMMLSPVGGLSAPGMAVVALLIGASTKVSDYV